MIDMKLIKPISALTSWEDYDYQGHIAIYYTLKMIKDMISANNSIYDYILQLEGEEDFAIRKKDEFISLHQVKAGVINSKDDDKFAFIIGLLENDDATGYFHITNNKKLPKNFVQTTLQYIDRLLKDLKKPLCTKRDLEQKNKGDLKGKENAYIVLDKIAGSQAKADVYSIINYVSKSSEDLATVQNSIKDISSTLLKHKSVIEQRIKNLKQQEYDSIFVNEYDVKFNNAKEIREATYPIIEEIIRTVKPEYSFAKGDYLKIVYDKLFLLMKEKITEVYIKKTKPGRCELKFSEILEVLKTDVHKEMDTIEYQYFLTLCAIRDSFYTYSEVYGCNDNCSECKDKISCNLFEQITRIMNLNEKEQEEVIQNLLLETPKVGKSNNLPTDDLIGALLLNVIHEINEFYLSRKNILIANDKKNHTYRLSLDSSHTLYTLINHLKEATSNPDSKSLLFECDYLITDSLSKERIQIEGNNVTKLNPKDIDMLNSYGIKQSTIEDYKYDCNKPKIIQIINKTDLIGEWNNE